MDQANAHLGTGLSRAGDLNGDGYADFAVGARLSDAGAGNQGQVRVILSNFNMNNNNCNINSARMVTLASGSANAQVGASVAGGADRFRFCLLGRRRDSVLGFNSPFWPKSRFKRVENNFVDR